MFKTNLLATLACTVAPVAVHAQDKPVEGWTADTVVVTGQLSSVQIRLARTSTVPWAFFVKVIVPKMSAVSIRSNPGPPGSEEGKSRSTSGAPGRSRMSQCKNRAQ